MPPRGRLMDVQVSSTAHSLPSFLPPSHRTLTLMHFASRHLCHNAIPLIAHCDLFITAAHLFPSRFHPTHLTHYHSIVPQLNSLGSQMSDPATRSAACPICGAFFKQRGLKKHMALCQLRMANHTRDNEFLGKEKLCTAQEILKARTGNQGEQLSDCM